MNRLTSFCSRRTNSALVFVFLAAATLLVPSAGAKSGSTAAVASPEPHATDIAAAVLERGGNAVDAAVATAFALAVTLPDAGNIGGGGFMTLVIDGSPYFLDYRETAPQSAHRDMYLDDMGQVVTGASVTGHLAVGTPGTVAGLWVAHQRFGRLPWDSLVAPAVTLAEKGFIAAPWLEEAVAGSRSRLTKTNFLDYFGAVRAGERFRQPALAKTLTAIAEHGRDGFYTGWVAKALADEMSAGDGLVDVDDLAKYKPRWRVPLRHAWRDYEIITAPLPSSGGFAVSQYLSVRDLLDPSLTAVEHNSPLFIHVKAEIEKRIFADRARYLGDPDFVDFDLALLLEPDYLQTRAAEVNGKTVSPTDDVVGGLEGKHTTHFSIVDGDGNAVSNTYTLNTDFGSGVVVDGAGFLLNNEMDDFSAAPGEPNYFGVVGDEANAIAPGKRMLSSMSPTILTRQGDVTMVLGAMGGSTIFTTVYQTITNLVDYGMSAEAALAAPRVHHQLLPKDVITFSPGTPLPEVTQRALRDMGYTVVPHDWEFGNVQLITASEQGELSAVSDPRFAGKAVVIDLD